MTNLCTTLHIHIFHKGYISKFTYTTNGPNVKDYNQFCNPVAIFLAADALGFNFVPEAVSNKYQINILSLKENPHKLYEKLTCLNLRYRSETCLSLFLMG
jgi:hypothetical protein